jgi:hypothetical protein
MKRFTKGKFAAALLAVALTLAASVAAFATWPSFQNDPATNNGVVTVAPPITTPGRVLRVGLTTNDPPELNPPYPSSVFAGIDTESVIGGGYIYTVYNGGVTVPNSIGGARLAITNLLTGVSNNIQLAAAGNNISQLSTPYYYEPTGSVIALVTRKTGSGYGWEMYGVSSPTTSPVIEPIRQGKWQANTPITAYTPSGEVYLYFGTWSYDDNADYEGIGDGAYYQYTVKSNDLKMFVPPVSDDFYGAGAAVVTGSDGKPYVVFGSDGYGGNPGNVYVRPVGEDFADNAYGKVISMNALFPDDKIRSSMAYDTTSQALYFTSRVAESQPSPGTYTGHLWKLPVSSLLTTSSLSTYVGLSGASTSTPVISENGYVYVGTYSGFTSGTVEAFPVSNFVTGAKVPIYSGDPVQASPIVYTDQESTFDDYIYFTTNSGSGKGYCYSYGGTGTTPQSRWSAGGTSGNRYAEQGFASDNGYLVYGDDSNTLYIMR